MFLQRGRVTDMASEPIPDPPTNQRAKSNEEEPIFSPSRRGPELVDYAASSIPAERELPRARRQKEWKEVVRYRVGGAKGTASRVKQTAAYALEEAQHKTAAALTQAKDRATNLYRESRHKTAHVFNRVRSCASYVVDEHPLQVIAGIAAAAFIAGVLLRIWRSSRDA
jgi:ElaB/YqjD/DUF883 family membrane-anchored ribosome-binding protein